jgi:ribosomal protein S18 acetylase RimI-like enzyme
MHSHTIVPYDDPAHRREIIELWQVVFGYEAAHNEPNLAINQKLAVDDGLFYVAVVGDIVVGSIMAGYDGHRGWLYSLAVLPGYRHQSIGSDLVRTAERALANRGCLKINLQILQDNERVHNFYTTLGYSTEPRISMGKLIR